MKNVLKKLGKSLLAIGCSYFIPLINLILVMSNKGSFTSVCAAICLVLSSAAAALSCSALADDMKKWMYVVAGFSGFISVFVFALCMVNQISQSKLILPDEILYCLTFISIIFSVVLLIAKQFITNSIGVTQQEKKEALAFADSVNNDKGGSGFETKGKGE